jgi:hypothetical protein
MAAEKSLAEFPAKTGSHENSDKHPRASLVATLAAIAGRAGIMVDRCPRAGELNQFGQLLQYVFERVCITIKPDTAIKEFMETRAK